MSEIDADVIDEIAGLELGSRLAELRRQRAEVFRHAQGSHDVLLLPQDAGGVSRAERAAIALRVALAAKDEKLAAHYRSLLRHTDLVADAPRRATAADLRRLEALGLTSRDIVAVSQLVAFVSFQTRLLAGLRILQEEGA